MAPLGVVRSAKLLAVFVVFPLLLARALNANDVMTHVQTLQCAVFSSSMAYLLLGYCLHPLRVRFHTNQRVHCAPPRKTEYLTMIGFFVMLWWFWYVGRVLVPFDFCSPAQCNDSCLSQYAANQDTVCRNMLAKLENDHQAR